MVKKAKLHLLRRPKTNEAQDALRQAFETFNTPELAGFFIIAWDKGADPQPCIHSPDLGLLEVAAACQMELQTMHTITCLAQEGIIRLDNEEG